MLKLIAFDLDDTLYCEHDFVRGGFQAVAEHIAAQTGNAAVDLYDRLIGIWRRNGRGRVFDTLAAELGLELDIPTLVAVYRRHTPRLTLYPDVAAVLAALAYAGHCCLALLTDGDRDVQRRKIATLGIEGFFHYIIVTDDWGPDYAKPHERAYRTLMAECGVPAAACLYIGDNPHKDFVTAKKLGWRTVRVVRPEGDYRLTRLDAAHEAEYAVTDLREIFHIWPELGRYRKTGGEQT